MFCCGMLMELKWTLRFFAIQRSRFFVSAGFVAQSDRRLVEIFAINVGGRGGFFFSVRRSGTTGNGRGGRPSALACCAGGLAGGLPRGIEALQRGNQNVQGNRPKQAAANQLQQQQLRQQLAQGLGPIQEGMPMPPVEPFRILQWQVIR